MFVRVASSNFIVGGSIRKLEMPILELQVKKGVELEMPIFELQVKKGVVRR